MKKIELKTALKSENHLVDLPQKDSIIFLRPYGEIDLVQIISRYEKIVVLALRSESKKI